MDNSYHLELAVVIKSIEDIVSRREAISSLEISDLQSPEAKLIYKAILSLDNKNELIDANTTWFKISSYKDNTMQEEYFYELVSTYNHSNETIKQYIRKILDTIALKKIKEAIKEADKVIDQDKSVDEIYYGIEQLISNTFKKRKLSNIEPLSENMDKIISKIKSLSDSKNDLIGTTSGLDSLDKMTKGFSDGDFIILAARPSMGKTAMALNFLVNASNALAKSGEECVVLFSIEMSKEQIVQRIISYKSAISLEQIRQGKLNSKELDMIDEFSAKIKRSNIWINDNSGVRLSQIQMTLRELALRKKIKLVVIDYLQLINHDIKNESRQQEITHISKGLKALAREIEAPIIGLSQLSRKTEQREDKRPIMSDLRESGALEQDADLVMFLYRESYYDKKSYAKNDYDIAELILAKHRNGPTGSIKLNFLPSLCNFTDK